MYEGVNKLVFPPSMEKVNYIWQKTFITRSLRNVGQTFSKILLLNYKKKIVIIKECLIVQWVQRRSFRNFHLLFFNCVIDDVCYNKRCISLIIINKCVITGNGTLNKKFISICSLFLLRKNNSVRWFFQLNLLRK